MFDLGLTETQFWESTPRELDALWKRLAAREEREYRNFALLMCQQANLNRGKDAPAIPLDRFLGKSTPEQKQKNPGVFTEAYVKHRQDDSRVGHAYAARFPCQLI